MKRILTFLSAAILLSLLPQTVHAQWKVGVNAGAAYNHYAIDKQYMTDYRFVGAWGATMGVMSQYNFTDWLGIRGELNFSQRSYRHTRDVYAERLDCLYRNDYLLLPVLANFSFGGKALRAALALTTSWTAHCNTSEPETRSGFCGISRAACENELL